MYNQRREIVKGFLKFLNEASEPSSKGEKKSKQPTLKMIYSDNFRKSLNSIMNMKQSNISKRLLELENDDKFFDFSYIDIDPKEPESITYLQSSRVERFKREEKAEEEYWTSKSRVKQKIGRFIKQVLSSFSDKSIEKFADKFKTIVKEAEESGNFELVEGDDIVFWYNFKNYASDRGTLGGSCMCGGEAGRYFNIYKNNPEQCKMLILKTPEGDKIKGRAIVWKLSEPKDKIFMDRIYTNVTSDELMFINYAKREGWLCKSDQRYGETNISIPGEGSKIITLEVVLDDKNFDLYPYLDTMRYFYPEQSLLRSEKSNKDLGTLYTLTDTEGHYMEFDEWDDEDYVDPLVHDSYNNREIPESQSVWCETDDGYCHRDDAIRLAYNGTFAFPNSKNVVYSDYSKKNYDKKDCVFSKPLNTWIWNKYAVDVYHDKNKKQAPDTTHRFELDKTIGKIGDTYYDIDLLNKAGSKQVSIKDKPGKFKTEYTYDFK